MRKQNVILAIFFIVVASVTLAVAADLYNNAVAIPVIYPYDHGTGDGESVGEIVDSLGYNSVTYVISTGSLADVDATFTVLLEHCAIDNCSDAEEVPDSLLRGTEALASFTFAADNSTRMLGYAGTLRYSRITITPANNTGAALLSAIAILGHPQYAPVTH